ncbi:FGFR1 oncogene partner 2 homolog isoform X2 [Phymastichus coffea]|nr:FGFR1 oncogene partner 2 homolog isoform X2 [Phymastichus coffea]XP_058789254.1 FGFR1 oncogene partner 2 homolog isoform X2 [Phymastichus coffea]XP_058789255.1 FGFR1 oncogene partner 2 homolog isoform X2 [Phymastichus coffea]
MALTFQQIILDAGELVNEITTQENTADILICEIQSVCNQIDSMKQYQEDIETLNEQSNQKQREELVASYQKGNYGYFRELQAENKDLKLALEDYQKTMEQIMSKYRQQTAYFLRQTKQNYPALPSAKCRSQNNQCKCTGIIDKQAEKIDEMATVMRTAAEIDEENEIKYLETLGRLKKENSGLREILDIANKYTCQKTETSLENKTVQTDDL